MGERLPSGSQGAPAPGTAAVLQELSQAFLTLEHALTFYPEGHQSRVAPLARLLELLLAEARDGGEGDLAAAGESLLRRGQVLEDPPPVVRKLAALLGDLGIARLSWTEALTGEELGRFMARVAAAHGTGRRGVWEDAERYDHLRVEGPDYQKLMDAPEGEDDARRRGELWRALLPRLLREEDGEPAEAELGLLRESWGDPAALASLLVELLGPGAGAAEAVGPLRRLAGLAERAGGEAAPTRDALRERLAALGRALPPQLRLRLVEATMDEPAGGLFDAAFGSLGPADALALLGGAFSLDPAQIDRVTRVFQHLVPRRLDRMELAPQLRGQVGASRDPDDPLADNAWEEVQELLTGESGEFMSPGYQAQLRLLAARENERRGGEAALAAFPGLPASLAPAVTAGESLLIQVELLHLATSVERYREGLEGLAGRCAAALTAGDRERGLWILGRLLELREGDEALAGPREEVERSLRGLVTAPVLTALVALLPVLADEERAAVQAFAALVPETAVPLLLDALAAEEEPARRRGIASLLEKGGPVALPALLRRLGDASAAEARLLLPLVAEAGSPSAVPALLGLLGRDDPRLRRDALRALVRLDTEEVRRALPPLLDDADPEIAQAAAAHLGTVGSPGIVREQLRVLAGGFFAGRHAERMQRAILVLGRMRAAEAVAPLGELLLRRIWINRRVQEQVCEDAAKALARIGGEEARRALELAAARGSEKVAALCRRLLARQGGA